MKFIYKSIGVILFCILYTDLFGQLVTNCGTVNFPVYLKSDYTYDFTNWDWTNQDRTNWIAENPTSNGKSFYCMRPPFVSNATTDMFGLHQEVFDSQDYLNNDPNHLIRADQGWILIHANFSHPSSPYFILYNKYRGVLRSFVYTGNYDSNVNKISTSLTVTQTGTSLLNNAHTPSLTDSDIRNNSTGTVYATIHTQFSQASWICSDFIMNFDQQISLYGGRLTFNVHSITDYEITLTGTASNANYNPDQYSVQSNNSVYSTGNTVSAIDMYNKAQSYINTGNEIVDKINVINEATRNSNIVAVKNLNESLSSINALNKLGEVFTNIGKVTPVVGAVFSILDMFNGEATTESGSTFQAIDLDINLTGSMKLASPLIVANINIPGSSRPNPLYNCPLGIISNSTPLELVGTSDFYYKYSMINNDLELIYNEIKNPYFDKTFYKVKVSNTPEFSLNIDPTMTLVDIKCAIIMEPKFNQYIASDKYISIIPITPHNSLGQRNPLYNQLNIWKTLKLYEKLPNGVYRFGSDYMSLECIKGFTFEIPVETEIYLSIIAVFKQSSSNVPIIIKKEFKTNGTWINTGARRELNYWEEYPVYPYSDYFRNINNITLSNNIFNTTYSNVYNLTATTGSVLTSGFYVKAGERYNCTGSTNSVVAYSAPSGCSNSQQYRMITLPNSPDETIEPLLVYPNPNTGSFNISLQFSQLGSSSLSIYNSTGTTVLKKELGEIDVHTESIELNNLAQGIYIIKVVHNGSEYYKKVTINN